MEVQMSRVIPGLQAEIIDFQIQSDPITNPGEIVVLLCDLPDQVTITDPENPDETITDLIKIYGGSNE